MSATFVSGRDIYKIQYLEKFTHSRIRKGTIPTPGEVEGKRSELMLEKVRALLSSGNFSDQMQFTDRLMEEGFQATEVCSALFSILLGQDATGGEQQLPPPPKQLPRDEDRNYERERDAGFDQPRRFAPKKSFADRGAVKGAGKPAFQKGVKKGFKSGY
jgi:hypothetical protein